jgi:hypothetical protein
MRASIITAAAAAIALTTGAAFAGQATPTTGTGAGQPDAHAAPIGQERATRNSAGGDREKGAFGQAQSDFVTSGDFGTSKNYGQYLQDNGWTGSSK